MNDKKENNKQKLNPSIKSTETLDIFKDVRKVKLPTNIKKFTVPEIKSVQEKQMDEMNKAVRFVLPAYESNMAQIERAAQAWRHSMAPSQNELAKTASDVHRSFEPSFKAIERAVAQAKNTLESPLTSLGKVAQDFKTYHELHLTQVNRVAEEIRKSLSYSQQTVSNVFLGHLEKLPSTYQVVIHEHEEEEKEYGDDAPKELVLKNEATNKAVPLLEMPAEFGVLDILDNISEEEVIMFYQHLTEYPMLGLYHEVGKKMLDGAKQVTLKTLDELPIKVFRARIREAERKTPFSFKEMFEAPYGVSGNGRWNLTGHGVLYTCDKIEGAVQEIGGNKDKILDVVEWDMKQHIQYLDLTDKECPLFNFCQYPAAKSQNLEPAYLVPNFLAQCCQMAGIDAIKYKSSAYEGAINYVFFEPSKKWFEFKKVFAEYKDDITL